MKEEYFELLLNLNKKSIKRNEVPISALIEKDGKIIAKAYNKRNRSKNICDHAEIIAINKAAKKLKDWRLNGCNLYVTLKPCSMCESIINQSRLDKVYYLLEKSTDKKEYYKTKYIKANISTIENKGTQQLNEFFKNKRRQK